jgi:inhibitor of cysteine peptidase
VQLTERDDGRTIETRVGEALELRLPERATTGYRWSFERLDPSAVSVQEQQTSRPSSRPGAPGEAAWTLTPEKTGEWPVVLKLWRPWEGDASVRKRFEITLSVAAARTAT